MELVVHRRPVPRSCAVGVVCCEEGGLWGRGRQRCRVPVPLSQPLLRLQAVHGPTRGVKLAIHKRSQGVEALLVGGVVAGVAAGDEAGVEMGRIVGARKTLDRGATARRQRHNLLLQPVNGAIRARMCAL